MNEIYIKTIKTIDEALDNYLEDNNKDLLFDRFIAIYFLLNLKYEDFANNVIKGYQVGLLIKLDLNIFNEFNSKSYVLNDEIFQNYKQLLKINQKNK